MMQSARTQQSALTKTALFVTSWSSSIAWARSQLACSKVSSRSEWNIVIGRFRFDRELRFVGPLQRDQLRAELRLSRFHVDRGFGFREFFGETRQPFVDRRERDAIAEADGRPRDLRILRRLALDADDHDRRW